VFKRLFWLTVGAALGMGSSFWAMRTVRRTVARLAPEQVTKDVVSGAKSARAQVLAAIAEGRLGMQEREAQLRAEMQWPGGPQVGTR